MFDENINSSDSKSIENNNNQKQSIQTPLRKVNSNTFFYLPNTNTNNVKSTTRNDQILTNNSISKENIDLDQEQSLSSEEFYEASPTLEFEELYFPTLLNEINYPLVNVPIQPHMLKPLNSNINKELNLKNIPIANIPKSFPLNQENKTIEEDSLCKILEFEFKLIDDEKKSEEDGNVESNNVKKGSWWTRTDHWSNLIGRVESDQQSTVDLIDSNIDDIFVNIHKF
ncbi:uncharacterized protein KGF55_004422 [Candida pseudojiufengensis]|uniref:uncharacterized protein n=1 Tax=Candida pseudojiufengensis TaxID=497109 RepID=UPI002224C0F4|nr:uncharacterized protein KGF55_004422 [Candida pseudojiufengensis]KAI5960852.1 hypothetical protein KGF55_004422 [Candida pseudojiufengensis]